MDWSRIQGSHLRTAESAMDKLFVLSLPGSPAIGDALALLMPPSPPPPATHSHAPVEAGPGGRSVEALVAWLMQRIPSEERPDEAKGAERSTYPMLASAVSRLGVMGLDPEELRRGHGPALCEALDSLCDLALRRQEGFAWGPPQYDKARWVSPASPAVAEAKESSPVAQRGQGQGVDRRSGMPAAGEAKAATAGGEAKAATAGGEGSRVQALRKARQALATQSRGKRARVKALRGELATLTSRALEAQRAAGTLEPLVALAAGATAGVRVAGEPSVADTATCVARMKAGLQVLRQEVQRLDVRVGMAQRQLLVVWQHGGGGQGDDGKGPLFMLHQSRDGIGTDGGPEEDDDEEE